MKLLYCKKCNDCFVLQAHRVRTCECGECSGRYTEDPNAVYSGDAIIFAIDNTTFHERYREALKADPNRKPTSMDNLIGRGQIGCFIMSPEMPNWHSIKKLPIGVKM